MDNTILEQLITALMDKTFERLQVKDRVEQVNICLGTPLGIHVTIVDGTSSRGGTWNITVEEERKW